MSSDFSHLLGSTLIPIGMMVLLFGTGAWAQAEPKSDCVHWLQARPKLIFLAPNPNKVCYRAGQSDAQIRFISSGLNADSLPAYRLTAGPADPWLGKDKADHFIVSAFLAGTCYYWARTELRQTHDTAVIFSLSCTGGIGLAKELYDGLSQRGTPSWKDLLADFLGIGIGILMLSQ